MTTKAMSKGGRTPSQFKATMLWGQIIHYVQVNVKRRQRRYFLKTHADCFSGADVTNTVLLYLLSDEQNFRSADISRVKAVKVCQLMLDDGVFHPLSGLTHKTSATSAPGFTPGGNHGTRYPGKRPLFRDSANKLYQFDKEGGTPGQRRPMRECTGLENPGFSEQSLDSSLMQQLLDMTSCALPDPTTPASRQYAAMATPASASKASRGIQSHQGVHEQQREIVLSFLLQQIDLSQLEDLLQEGEEHQPIYDNLVFFDPSDSLEEVGLHSKYLSDPLVELAAAVLDFLPKGRDSFHKACSRSLSDCKSVLHLRIESHYSQLSQGLLPTAHTGVHREVSRLLEQRDLHRALRALNASLLLLPWHQLCEIETLLKYLEAFSKADLGLQTQSVPESFSRAFIQSTLPAHQSKLIVGLLIGNVQDICHMPADLQALVDKAIMGGDNGAVFCRRVDRRGYVQQTESHTERELIRLIDSIADHRTLTLKEKSSKLKLLKKASPDIFSTHFPQLMT